MSTPEPEPPAELIAHFRDAGMGAADAREAAAIAAGLTGGCVVDAQVEPNTGPHDDPNTGPHDEPVARPARP